MDPQGVRWDSNDAALEGYLVKKSKWIGVMRKRYMILKRNKIFFSKTEDAAPHGVIDLVDTIAVCQLVSASDAGGEVKSEAHGTIIEIRKRDETYLLQADDGSQAKRWVECIEAVVRPSLS